MSQVIIAFPVRSWPARAWPVAIIPIATYQIGLHVVERDLLIELPAREFSFELAEREPELHWQAKRRLYVGK